MATYTADGPEAAQAAKNATKKFSADPAHGSCAVVAAHSGDYKFALKNADPNFQQLLKDEWRREIERQIRIKRQIRQKSRGLRLQFRRSRSSMRRTRPRETHRRPTRRATRGSPSPARPRSSDDPDPHDLAAVA